MSFYPCFCFVVSFYVNHKKVILANHSSFSFCFSVIICLGLHFVIIINYNWLKNKGNCKRSSHDIHSSFVRDLVSALVKKVNCAELSLVSSNTVKLWYIGDNNIILSIDNIKREVHLIMFGFSKIAKALLLKLTLLLKNGPSKN